jgi:hypothetical protein
VSGVGPRRGRAGAAGLLAVVLALVAAAPARGEIPRDEPEAAAAGTREAEPDLPDYGPLPQDLRPRIGALSIPQTPGFKLTYSRFTARRIGGQGQPFNVPALAFYFISSWLRLGLTTRFGLEDASGNGSRDWFIEEAATLGLQAPGWLPHLLPFVEFSAGLGMRLFKTFNNSQFTSTWSYGLNFGTEIYLTRRFYLTAAIGWIRPIVSPKTVASPQQPEQHIDVFTDTFIFPVGFGI